MPDKKRMLSVFPNELARRSAWTCLSCSAHRSSQGLIASTKGPTSTHHHQRKYSSSKTPNSPKHEARAITAATKVPAEETTSAAPSEADKASSTRARKRKVKDAVQDSLSRDFESTHLNLPSVPSTQRIHPLGRRSHGQAENCTLTRHGYLDIHVASFFSQHRPISVSQVIPPAISTEVFSTLFDPPKPASKSKLADIMYTLSSAVDALDQAATQQEGQTPEEIDLRTAVTQASSSNAEGTPQPLDLPAKSLHINLQELAKNFRPFVPPPAPVPLAAMREAARNIAREQREVPQPTRHTTWTSTLTVYESTHPNGEKTYKTYATPIRQTPGNSSSLPPAGSQELEVIEERDCSDEEHNSRQLPASPRTQSFLGRMRERQIRYEDRMDEQYGRDGGEDMQAISVKRQRKLKMKKHKYKKLMKRTKNLRRRLDRT